ncbi:hypothetical protein [Chromobacterium violaceum]|nr:hypothetical protein [Chromobacterium violaceum]
MSLDRQYQLELLKKLQAEYPGRLIISGEFNEYSPEEKQRYVANMFYLEQHGLVDSGISHLKSMDGQDSFSVGIPQITHRGMDFLADDGGLTAILGTVTVKLHEETLKALLSKKIEQSDLAPADKSRWLAALAQLPAETTKHLVLKLVDLGLENSKEAMHQIGIYLGSLLPG